MFLPPFSSEGYFSDTLISSPDHCNHTSFLKSPRLGNPKTSVNYSSIKIFDVINTQISYVPFTSKNVCNVPS